MNTLIKPFLKDIRTGILSVVFLSVAMMFGYILRPISSHFFQDSKRQGSAVDHKTSERNKRNNVDPPFKTLNMKAKDTHFHAKLATGNPEKYSELLKKYEFQLLHDIFSEEAYANPANAAALFEQIDDEDTKSQLMGLLLTAWGEVDPKACFEWYRNSDESFAPQWKETFVSDVLTHLGKEEPEFAWSILNSTLSPEEQPDVLRDIAKGWANKDTDGAFDWLEQIWDSPEIPGAVLKGCFEDVFKVYSNKNPLKAAELALEANSSGLQKELIRYVVEDLGKEDVHQAMNWVLGIENEANRQEGLKNMVLSYGRDHPELVIDQVLANLNGSEESNQQLVDAFSYSSQQNPAAVARKLFEVPEKLQPDAVKSIAGNWFAIEPEQAEIWLGQQLSGRVRDAGIFQAIENYKYSEVDRALVWARQISDSNERQKIITELEELALWQD